MTLDLLTVAGVLAGIGVLLFLMSALDPTNAPRPRPSHRGTRDRDALATRRPVTEAPARRS